MPITHCAIKRINIWIVKIMRQFKECMARKYFLKW
jgi:hypothetical protein